MKDVYLINYAVKGIKSIDQWAKLSFYNKTFRRDFSIKGFNIKGIYGANGAGKSGIITSMKILKSIILDPQYLNNPLVQKQLDELINKSTRKLQYDVDFLVLFEDGLRLYHYSVALEKGLPHYYVITQEVLTKRKATAHSHNDTIVYSVDAGKLSFVDKNEKYSDMLREASINLLSMASLSSIFMSKGLFPDADRSDLSSTFIDLLLLFLFGHSIYVYLDTPDDHTEYAMNSLLLHGDEYNYSEALEQMSGLLEHKGNLNKMQPLLLTVTDMRIPKKSIKELEKQVAMLKDFLCIFKKDLKNITIDRKEDNSSYICSLIMDYGEYTIYAEFESTGIKKLIKLFTYLQKMVTGNIVFIDELDSNLHDVYLCALLEYLMEYGEGQLCFTTHNIGPMDILRKNQKSIDFLSVDRTVYQWTKNGNYSPSKLYKNGMIEGSPFNVDSIDFIGVFGDDGED